MKRLSAILSVIVAVVSINFTTISAQNNTGDEVLYENDFNNGLSDIIAVSEEDFNLSVITTGVKDANGGIWRDNGADKQNFLFDFTKGGTVDGLNSGAYKISYDFTVNESAKYGYTITGVNMKNHWDGGRAFYINTGGYDVMDYLNAYPSSYTSVQGTATLDMIIDFTTGKVKYYVNDENVGEQTNLDKYTPLTNYSIALSDAVACFDNLKITRLSNEAATATVKEAYNGDGYIDVVFSNEIIKNAEFYVDGEKASDVLWLDDFTARITFSDMLKVGAHTVSVKNGKDFLERTVWENEIEFNVLDSSKKNVLYENSFDNGTSDIVAVSEEDFDLSVVLGNVKAVNGGIWRDNGADKQNFLFDFTKGGTVDGLNSGAYKISYDFAVNEAASYGYTITGVNMKNHWDGGRAFYINTGGYDVMDYLNAYPNANSYTSVEGKATLDMVIDFTSGKVKYYINGENVGEQTNLANYTPVTNYSIALSDAVACFDNLKITKIEADNYGIIVEDTYDDCLYIDVKFTKDVLKKATFKLDETTVASENISWINANTARIRLDEELTIGTHSVFADAKDFLGNAPAFNTAVFEVKNSSDKYILYKNSFDNGASDAKSIENEYFTLTVQSEENYMPVDAEINGNKGVKLEDNTTGADYSTFFFDFTKGGKTTGLSDGIYKISYDFAIDSEAPYEAYSGFNMYTEYKKVWEGNRAVYFSKDGYSIMSALSGWDKSYVAVDGVASMDILIDFTKNEVSYYVNGEFIKKQTNLADKKPIRNYSLAMSGCFSYLDNLSITKIAEGSFEVTGVEAVVGDDKLKVYVNEPFGTIAASDVALTGGNVVSVKTKTETSLGIDNRYVLEVELQNEIKDADVYNVNLNNTAKNIVGNIVNSKKNNAQTTAKLIKINQATAELTYYNNSDSNMKPVLAVAEYNDKGALVDVDVVTDYTVAGEKVEAVAPGSIVKISATVKEGNKIFAWSDFDTLTPLGAAIECVGINKDLRLTNLVMTFKGDAQNSRGLAWVTDTGNDNMAVRYAESDEDFASNYIEVEATFTEHKDNLYYKADITGLEAGTEYVYIVGDISYDSWSEYYSFTTENRTEDEYSFLVYTDTQGETTKEYNMFKQLVDVSVEEVPDVKFMLSLGDFVETGYNTEQWKMYFDAVEDYTPTIPHMGIIGNHETRDNEETEYLDSGLEYRLYFNNSSDSAESIRENLSNVDLDRWTGGVVENIEGSVYSFDYGDVHFVALNSGSDWHNPNTLKLLEAQTEWLEKDLSETKAKWKVIFIHQGLYPAKIERYFGSRDVLEQIIDKYNVDLVLQGHDHMVARTYPMRAGKTIPTDNPQIVKKGDGTVYFIPGSAGKKRYSDIETIPDYMNLVVNTSSIAPTYSVVNVSDNKLEIITKDINNNIIDSFKITDN